MIRVTITETSMSEGWLCAVAESWRFENPIREWGGLGVGLQLQYNNFEDHPRENTPETWTWWVRYCILNNLLGEYLAAGSIKLCSSVQGGYDIQDGGHLILTWFFFQIIILEIEFVFSPTFMFVRAPCHLGQASLQGIYRLKSQCDVVVADGCFEHMRLLFCLYHWWSVACRVSLNCTSYTNIGLDPQ